MATKYSLVVLKNKIEQIGVSNVAGDHFSAPSGKVCDLTLADFLIANPANGSLGVIFNKQKALEIGGYRCFEVAN